MNTVLTDSDKAHAQSHLERARPFIGKICRAPFVAHASLQRPSNQPNAKLVHWIRHGQGFHNLMADFHREHGIEGSPYKHPALHDPPLTALGREQAAALCTHAKMLAPTLVVVSPLAHATKTALIAFDHLVGAVPFVAHELCREICGVRRPPIRSLPPPVLCLAVLCVPAARPVRREPLLPPAQASTRAMAAARRTRRSWTSLLSTTASCPPRTTLSSRRQVRSPTLPHASPQPWLVVDYAACQTSSVRAAGSTRGPQGARAARLRIPGVAQGSRRERDCRWHAFGLPLRAAQCGGSDRRGGARDRRRLLVCSGRDALRVDVV